MILILRQFFEWIRGKTQRVLQINLSDHIMPRLYMTLVGISDLQIMKRMDWMVLAVYEICKSFKTVSSHGVGSWDWTVSWNSLFWWYVCCKLLAYVELTSAKAVNAKDTPWRSSLTEYITEYIQRVRIFHQTNYAAEDSLWYIRRVKQIPTTLSENDDDNDTHHMAFLQ